MQMSQFHSIPAMFLDMCRSKDFPGWFRRVDGSWEEYLGKRLEELLFFASLAFAKYGVGEGKSLGIIASTSPNWIVADLACEVCHAPTVPLFSLLIIAPKNFAVSVIVFNFSVISPAASAAGKPTYNKH